MLVMAAQLNATTVRAETVGAGAGDWLDAIHHGLPSPYSIAAHAEPKDLESECLPDVLWRLLSQLC
jgi:hypothetical protein